MEYKIVFPHYVLEVSKIDLNRQYRDILPKLLELVRHYKIIIFRNQNIASAQHLSFMQNFGHLEASWDTVNTHSDYNNIHIIKTRKSLFHKKGSSEFWHIDSSFKPTPTLYVGLHCVERGLFTPNTLFINLEAAYQGLHSNIKKQISKLKAKHSFQMRFSEFRRTGGISNHIIMHEVKTFPDVAHDITRIHPITGAKILFLNPLCIKEICGMSYEESHNLLQYLYLHSTNKKYLYQHQWQLGDFVLYDNQSLMHQREYKYIVGHRVLHRVSVS